MYEFFCVEDDREGPEAELEGLEVPRKVEIGVAAASPAHLLVSGLLAHRQAGLRDAGEVR